MVYDQQSVLMQKLGRQIHELSRQAQAMRHTPPEFTSLIDKIIWRLGKYLIIDSINEMMPMAKAFDEAGKKSQADVYILVGKEVAKGFAQNLTSFFTAGRSTLIEPLMDWTLTTAYNQADKAMQRRTGQSLLEYADRESQPAFNAIEDTFGIKRDHILGATSTVLELLQYLPGGMKQFAQGKNALKGATVTTNTAVNAADALRLRTYLTFQEKGILTVDGKLTQKAIDNSTKIDLKKTN